MDKFLGHIGRIGFWLLVMISWVDAIFSTGDYLSNYWIFYAMVCMWCWFDYKVQSTVMRHIVHLPYEENDDEEIEDET